MSPLNVLCICLLFGVGSLAHTDLLPDHRILGGVEVDISSHPYQLTFQIKGKHECGASIISKKWAVTAGHCSRENQDYFTLGAGNTHRYNATLHKVVRVIVHPEFIGEENDIALLEIEDEFTYGENVQPIKLADRELEAGELANVTGWGVTSQESPDVDLLRRATVPIVKRETCADIYEPIGHHVTDLMICAGLLGEGGKDGCQKDSGGPLAANGILYGIISWGRGCGTPEYPGVYSNIAKLRPWIISYTGI